VPTLEAFAPRFIEGHAQANRHKPSGIAAHESILKWHLVPLLGAKRLDGITNEQVQKVKLALADRAPKTVNNVLTLLRIMLRKAVETRPASPGQRESTERRRDGPRAPAQVLAARFHARAHPDPLIAVQQQRPQIAQVGRRHPDRRKAILREQAENQCRVSPVVFLAARFDLSDLRGITDVAGDTELLHQPQNHPIDPVASMPTTIGGGRLA
jgi:hypothetical protein